MAPNLEARVAPRMIGGELLHNARTREGQRNLGRHLGIVQIN